MGEYGFKAGGSSSVGGVRAAVVFDRGEGGGQQPCRGGRGPAGVTTVLVSTQTADIAQCIS